ncbi:hypothetical protein LCGC14_1198740 [marine sediment metagenome]|uniref:Uncharacterized protein n=1 Tax=marine sediment metagenome TaxID=412755 RepID=A0A0F9LHK7_9ZZZZ
MERTGSTPNDRSETGEIKERKSIISLNREIEKIVEEFLKSEQSTEISEIFSRWILDFIEQDVFIHPDSDFKLYDIYELFNQTLIIKTTAKDPKDTTPTKSKHFEIDTNLIEEIIRRAVKNPKIFQFIKSSEWNELRKEFFKKFEINHECIESLEKLIMYQNLMQLKIDKYKLKQGW